ncbi:hypothetical protein GG804_08530 [Sphingomonas histidinilytica]|uniref:hypothetical protein n=1 Tax=Rhizorhabdus histidinilytica TaxID=439228 RepID=UPI001ADC3314|nr:hypothetical protein [Rhizorhabdus histidinilytica]MBO9376811.1 hypothetical protein [Rhizorhabdus histidinilytica]
MEEWNRPAFAADCRVFGSLERDRGRAGAGAGLWEWFRRADQARIEHMTLAGIMAGGGVTSNGIGADSTLWICVRPPCFLLIDLS